MIVDSLELLMTTKSRQTKLDNRQDQINILQSTLLSVFKNLSIAINKDVVINSEDFYLLW